MKVKTPIITLLVGVALAAALLISSMTAVSDKKAALAAASASAAASTPCGRYHQRRGGLGDRRRERLAVGGGVGVGRSARQARS